MRRVLLLLPVLALAGCGLGRASAPPSPHCRASDPLAGVYHPSRLHVRSRCRTATGIVEAVRFEAFDGDVHVELRLDDPDHHLLSRGNDQRDGNLIVEVIPQDRSTVPIPDVGTRVTVAGPWVDDTAHDWREIHPAWWISAGTIVPASPEELARADDLLRSGGNDEG